MTLESRYEAADMPRHSPAAKTCCHEPPLFAMSVALPARNAFKENSLACAWPSRNSSLFISFKKKYAERWLTRWPSVGLDRPTQARNLQAQQN